MTDLAVRISLFLSGGLICRECGVEIDGKLSGAPRTCDGCRSGSTSQTAVASPRLPTPAAAAR